MRLLTILRQLQGSFSFVGLVIGTAFLALSLTPTLLPRHFVTQGLLSGIALAVGYGLGIFITWLWNYLEIPTLRGRADHLVKWLASLSAAAVSVVFLWRTTTWQNSIRERMLMEPVVTAYPSRVAAIALITGLVLILFGRSLRIAWSWIDQQIRRYVPRRVSYVVSAFLVTVAAFLILNNVLARWALDVADATFLQINEVLDDEIVKPTHPLTCGGPDSLITWKTIGRQGKVFISTGPQSDAIGEFWGSAALQPLRVYAGLGSAETMEARADLALQELIRVGGFDKSILVVATPTGTGWLDPGAVDSIEYLHRGDTAIVSMQYSYLPSWITILVDPQRSRESARVLFGTIYSYWRTLDREQRPRLYLHGLSLGALGSESSADVFTIFEDPIQGGLWSGPPFPSPVWRQAIKARKPETPMWLPQFRDGSLLRFTGRKNALPLAGERWGAMRFVYIQHASDPMTFFSPHLLYRKPEWLLEPRGPDVTPYLRWMPIVTFLQTAFDLPMATTVPTGFGHNISASSYIDSWIEVTEPDAWDASMTERLKRHLTN